MKIVSVASARPNFVKLAAVHHALAAKAPKAEHLIVHTGQHYDPLFSDIFFEQLHIPTPAINLGIHGGTREEVVERTDQALRPVLRTLRPDAVMVYGDVNGALGGARAAKDGGFFLAHVEAGLRSFDLSMPEELNRVAVDELADLLLCTERSGMENLAAEGVKGRAELVGNTMIDTLVRMKPIIEQQPLHPEAHGNFAVATLHRPSNVDDPVTLASVLRFLGDVGEECPVILPVHHRLGARLKEFHLEQDIPRGLKLVEPLGYLPFLRLMQGSQFVLTDSGGLQEEATFLGKRCFTLRRNTERPSTVESGCNILVDPAVSEDRNTVLAFAKIPVAPSIQIPPLWDGKAGERIVEILVR